MTTQQIKFWLFIIYAASCLLSMGGFAILNSVIRKQLKNNRMDRDQAFKIGFSIVPFIPIYNQFLAFVFLKTLIRERFNISRIKSKLAKRLKHEQSLNDIME